jgi:hypothetical protein
MTECIAEHTRRPLLALTVSNIPDMAIEQTMTMWFSVAADWGAIMLIDEADIFLEKRKGNNLQRNGLVSGKLYCTSGKKYADIS